MGCPPYPAPSSCCLASHPCHPLACLSTSPLPWWVMVTGRRPRKGGPSPFQIAEGGKHEWLRRRQLSRGRQWRGWETQLWRQCAGGNPGTAAAASTALGCSRLQDQTLSLRQLALCTLHPWWLPHPQISRGILDEAREGRFSQTYHLRRALNHKVQ